MGPKICSYARLNVRSAWQNLCVPEIAIGARIRTSPFFDSTVSAGASSFTIYNGMYMPTGYGDARAEYERLTENIALWDVAAERQVEIVGPDAAALTQYVCARSLRGMVAGRARYAPMCDHQGRLINDPIAMCLDNDRYWLSIADSDALLWVRAVAGERGADVEVFEPDVSPLAVQGPRADELGRELFGDEVIEALGFFHHRTVELDDIPMVLCRSGWSKQGGFELFLTDGSKGTQLWDLVMAAGETFGIGPGTPNHAERIESGLLSFGSDHDRDTDPIEAGLGAFTSLASDVDFCGKQALQARVDSTTRRPIVNITFDSPATESRDIQPASQPTTASVDGKVVGEIRTSVWGPRLNAWIGLAQLQAPFDAPGTTIESVDGAGRTVTAVVTNEPFGTIRTS